MTSQLVKSYKKKKGNIEVILVNHDTDQKKMNSYMTKSKMPFPGLKKSENKTSILTKAYEAKFLPTLLLLDKNGKVVSDDQKTVLKKLVGK
ncbi:MAG: thioredoxin-like domain-containing protein [Verrucomicrobiota bacterium]